MKSGVLMSYRDKFKLIISGLLTDTEFVLYECCIHLADFDEKHVGAFGTLPPLTKEQLANEVGWKEDKTRRNFNELAKKGFLKLRIDTRIEVVGFDRYLPKNAFTQKEIATYLREETAKVSLENAEMLSKNANLPNQSTVLATKTISISDTDSYKVNTFIKRSRADYEVIVKELKFLYTDASDLEWIDKWINQRSQAREYRVQGGRE